MNKRHGMSITCKKCKKPIKENQSCTDEFYPDINAWRYNIHKVLPSKQQQVNSVREP